MELGALDPTLEVSHVHRDFSCVVDTDAASDFPRWIVCFETQRTYYILPSLYTYGVDAEHVSCEMYLVFTS